MSPSKLVAGRLHPPGDLGQFPRDPFGFGPRRLVRLHIGPSWLLDGGKLSEGDARPIDDLYYCQTLLGL